MKGGPGGGGGRDFTAAFELIKTSSLRTPGEGKVVVGAHLSLLWNYGSPLVRPSLGKFISFHDGEKLGFPLGSTQQRWGRGG